MTDHELASKFAPHLIFNRREEHFPEDAEKFRRHSMFLFSPGDGVQSLVWKDEAHPAERYRTREQYATPQWDRVLAAIARGTEDKRPGGPTRRGPVTRPRDENNLWSHEGGAGYFLKLVNNWGRSGSGVREPGDTYYQFDKNVVVGNRKYTMLQYWVFYVQNNFLGIFTHEGDWEHITLYFSHDRPARPEWLFFAGHEGGKFKKANSRWVSWTDDTHVRVYVSHLGHPTLPHIHRRFRYQYVNRRGRFYDAIRTWEGRMIAIEETPWHRYCGAWGDKGLKAFTTGPLGPFFKLSSDVERFRRR